MGAKEGLVHLMWVLVEPGDAALVPAPELPDPHPRPDARGGERFQVPMGPERISSRTSRDA